MDKWMDGLTDKWMMVRINILLIFRFGDDGVVKFYLLLGNKIRLY